MRKYFLLFFAVIAFAGCQKGITDAIIGTGDNGGGNTGGDSLNSIIGTWDFIGLNAQTQVTNESDVLGTSTKLVALMNYTSINNAGTISFDASNMSITGLTYGVNTNITTYTYIDGNSPDSITQPTSFEFPATTSSTPYKMITSDSIYFQNGGFAVQTSSPTIQAGPSGGRISFSGDSLILKQNLSFDSTSIANGITSHIYGNVTGNIFMKKHQ